MPMQIHIGSTSMVILSVIWSESLFNYWKNFRYDFPKLQHCLVCCHNIMTLPRDTNDEETSFSGQSQIIKYMKRSFCDISALFTTDLSISGETNRVCYVSIGSRSKKNIVSFLIRDLGLVENLYFMILFSLKII